eukprot:TRINITY_DN1050_c0_g2_i2.p1 TRINITY_DN1050_c0_g2~~TRINITY_DN1050_c0_g2_i2.p1  ORF type:complete len:178 (-),score=16.88 TRINITY_DN1050_c0_g2_i2:85-618(-)
MTLRQSKEGTKDKLFFSCVATIIFVKHDENSHLFYFSCPNGQCKKKVREVTDNSGNTAFYCEKCNQTYHEFNARYVLNMLIADHTNAEWSSAFDDVGTTLLGRTANEVRILRDQRDPMLEYIFEDASFRRYTFQMQTKEEPYQDSMRVKYSINFVAPVNYAEESKKLLEKIAQIHNS